MESKKNKSSILIRLRNYFFTGAVVLIPIGITLYLSLFIIKISSKILPKELNPNKNNVVEAPIVLLEKISSDLDKIVNNKKEGNIGVQTLRIFKNCKVCTPMFPSFLFFTNFRISSSPTYF